MAGNAARISDKSINRGVWSLRCTRGNCPPSIAKPCWLHGRFGRNRPFGLDLVGYLLSEIGLGESARLLVSAVDAVGIPVGLINVPLAGRQNETALADRVSISTRHRVALSVSGLAELKGFARRSCRGQVNIAYPYWELPTVPTSWKRAFEGFDAYWAPTNFIREVLTAYQTRPVHLIPQPVRLPDIPPTQRTFRGPLKLFTFFDYESKVSRKNPFGAILAFLSAFPTGEKDVELVIKARGAASAKDRTELHALVNSDPRIKILEGFLSRVEMSALLDECDVFISLHRSEGFGLGCAEALARGKIVVATDFGGTRDFISDETGYPVAFSQVALTELDYPGGDSSFWAEPSVEHAASILREIYSNPMEAAKRPLAGLELLRANNSFEVVGKRILEALAAR